MTNMRISTPSEAFYVLGFENPLYVGHIPEEKVLNAKNNPLIPMGIEIKNEDEVKKYAQLDSPELKLKATLEKKQQDFKVVVENTLKICSSHEQLKKMQEEIKLSFVQALENLSAATLQIESQKAQLVSHLESTIKPVIVAKAETVKEITLGRIAILELWRQAALNSYIQLIENKLWDNPDYPDYQAHWLYRFSCIAHIDEQGRPNFNYGFGVNPPCRSKTTDNKTFQFDTALWEISKNWIQTQKNKRRIKIRDWIQKQNLQSIGEIDSQTHAVKNRKMGLLMLFNEVLNIRCAQDRYGYVKSPLHYEETFYRIVELLEEKLKSPLYSDLFNSYYQYGNKTGTRNQLRGLTLKQDMEAAELAMLKKKNSSEIQKIIETQQKQAQEQLSQYCQDTLADTQRQLDSFDLKLSQFLIKIAEEILHAADKHIKKAELKESAGCFMYLEEIRKTINEIAKQTLPERFTKQYQQVYQKLLNLSKFKQQRKLSRSSEGNTAEIAEKEQKTLAPPLTSSSANVVTEQTTEPDDANVRNTLDHAPLVSSARQVCTLAVPTEKKKLPLPSVDQRIVEAYKQIFIDEYLPLLEKRIIRMVTTKKMKTNGNIAGKGSNDLEALCKMNGLKSQAQAENLPTQIFDQLSCVDKDIDLKKYLDSKNDNKHSAFFRTLKKYMVVQNMRNIIDGKIPGATNYCEKKQMLKELLSEENKKLFAMDSDSAGRIAVRRILQVIAAILVPPVFLLMGLFKTRGNKAVNKIENLTARHCEPCTPRRA